MSKSSTNFNGAIKVSSIDDILNKIEKPKPLPQGIEFSSFLSLEEENRQLKSKLKLLEKEVQSLREQIKIQTTNGSVSLSNISIDALINQVKDKTKNKSKLGFFKKMLAQNKEIRK